MTDHELSELQAREAELFESAKRNPVPGSPEWEEWKATFKAVETERLCRMLRARFNAVMGTVAQRLFRWECPICEAHGYFWSNVNGPGLISAADDGHKLKSPGCYRKLPPLIEPVPNAEDVYEPQS